MKHYLGLLERDLGRNATTPVFYEPEKLINGHMLLCGTSGTGKTFQTMRFLASAARAGLGVDVFDVHEELDTLPGAKAVKYSQATRYGNNPLEIDPDPHVGGPMRQANFIIGLVKEITSGFGSQQEAVLRNLLLGVWRQAGIEQSEPSTWSRKSIDEATRTRLVDQFEYAKLREYYPTLDDLDVFAKRKILSLTIGSDDKTVIAFEQLVKTVQKLFQQISKKNQASDPDAAEKLAVQVEAQKSKVIGLYESFIMGLETGREIDDVLAFESADMLTSIMRRIDSLGATGIFRANPPPFGDCRVRVHQIKSLATDEQSLFVKLSLRRIFDEVKKLGPTRSGTELRRIVFLDEAHKYFSKDPDDILNVVVKEARKFGLALWCASQQPTEFPESFVANVGATVLLGVNAMYWKRMTTMMRISEEQLMRIRPKQALAIKMQAGGLADPDFMSVVVPNPDTEEGRRAAALVAQREMAA